MAAPGVFPGQGMPSQGMPSQAMPGQSMPGQQMAGYAPTAMPAGYAPQPTGGPSANLFDEAGLRQAAAGSMPCPGCTTPLLPGTVICVKCGYNLKLGKKMTTINMDRPEASGDGHGGAAAMLLAKAAAAVEEDREYEASKGKEGMPWWGYLLILMGLLGFTVLMMTLPPEVAMKGAGVTIMVGCAFTSFYYHLRNWMTAFEEGMMHGLLCVFIGPYYLYYVYTRWEKCGGNFLTGFFVGLFGNLGYVMIFLSGMLAGDGGNG